VVGLERRRDARADVAAAGDHDAPDRFQHAAQLAHHRADELGRGQHEDFVAGLDDGVALGIDRLVLAENRGDAGVDPGGKCSRMALIGLPTSRPPS
jgi:hypothetical protein